MYKIVFLALILAAFNVNAGTNRLTLPAGGSGGGGGSFDGSVTQNMDDDIYFCYGDGDDYCIRYKSSTGRLELLSSDVDGSGTDGLIWAVYDGGDTFTIAGDMNILGDSFLSKLESRGGAVSGDTATTHDNSVKGMNATYNAVTNTSGGNLNLSGGVGTKYITPVQATGVGSTLTFIVNYQGVITTTTATAVAASPGANEYLCITSDTACASSLASWITSNIDGLAGFSLTGVVYATMTNGVYSFDLTSADGSGTAFVVVNGEAGDVRMSGEELYLTAGGVDYVFDATFLTLGGGIDMDGKNFYANGAESPSNKMRLYDGGGDGQAFYFRAGTGDRVMIVSAAGLTMYADKPLMWQGTNSLDCTTDGLCVITNSGGNGYSLKYEGADGRVGFYNKAGTALGRVYIGEIITGGIYPYSGPNTDGAQIDNTGTGTWIMGNTGFYISWTEDNSYTATQTLKVSKESAGLLAIDDDRGAGVIVGQSDEVTVTFSGGGDASQTATGFRETQKLIKGVSGRVTTAGTTCTSFDVGDGSDVDRYGAAIAVSSGTTFDIADATADPSEFLTSAGDVVITANGGNCVDLVVKLNLHHITYSAATSN